MNQVLSISEDQYHADPCEIPSLSCSIAKILLSQSPLHAWLAHPKLNPNFVREEDSRMDLGTVAHQMLLESDSTKVVWIAAEDWRTKAAKDARDKARAQGQLPLLAKYQAPLEAMVREAKIALGNSEFANTLFQPEQTLSWKEPIVGAELVQCRARLDWLSEDRKVILDYKTVEDANPESFIRQIGRMGYDVQAEFYMRGIEAITGRRPEFVFLAQEINAPYACSFIALGNTYKEVAKARVDYALQEWHKCLSTDTWPAYPRQVHYAEAPSWLLNQMHMSEAA